MRIRRLPSPAAMRPVFLSFYFFLTVHAAVSVHPSNSSLHLSDTSYAAFRIWGFNYLDGQHLAPLTQNLLDLTDLQAKVCLSYLHATAISIALAHRRPRISISLASSLKLPTPIRWRCKVRRLPAFLAILPSTPGISALTGPSRVCSRPRFSQRPLCSTARRRLIALSRRMDRLRRISTSSPSLTTARPVPFSQPSSLLTSLPTYPPCRA